MGSTVCPGECKVGGGGGGEDGSKFKAKGKAGAGANTIDVQALPLVSVVSMHRSMHRVVVGQWR